jgi:hypothetical protein
MSAPPSTQVRTFHIAAPRAQVFPMFTPLGERAWAEGWEPMMLSGLEERGTAFITRGQDGRETTWIVTEYHPAEGRASYARLAHGSNIGLVDVVCADASDGGTDVSVRYTLTGVSEQGRAFVAEFLDDTRYTAMIQSWREAVTAALQRQ